ncbi:hypothetical protein BV97_01945 [Novosphingobium resinovorum]|uniref:DUF2274 domain-containing protein n=1 Tax=Novosphingobium resinovorum TaxID=158500 RepID=A0A031K0A1_9SPHN|nr:DUF2274 domain-containing protein [Novosphingobium resinovorum]EZP82448.1 hypothetical protein BV97_01945 [Novosphingobium resinovorum]
MTKLRLGPIDDDKPIKVQFELPGSVHRDLLAYAKVHAQETGLAQPLTVERLIAPMLARFMASDRGFARKSRDSG